MKLERGSRANDVSLSDLSLLLPEILELLPNDITDVEVQGAELTPLWNFDFREQSCVKVDQNKLEIKPAQLTVHGQEFNNLYRFGTFVYAISEKIAGLTHFGGLLFVQMNPNRPFERRLDLAAMLLAKQSENAPIVWADMLLDIGGYQYMKACFEYASKKANDALPVLLVLGEQHVDGRDENLEPYVCRNYAALRNKEGNIHQYEFDEIAKNQGLIQGVTIFHVNISAFENQYVDSPDIEKLYEIYSLSMGSKRPLMIHCTDGMDRAGGFAFAFHLLHNWRRIFNVLDAREIVKNIMTEHALMQQLRGPSFCTAYDRRLLGAVQLAMLMRSVQICKEIYLRDQKLNEQFKTKLYLQQLYALQQKKETTGFFSPNESELLAILQVRVKLEIDYFEEFAEGLQHPQVSMWQYDQLLPAADSVRELFQWIKEDFIKTCPSLQDFLNLQLDKNYRMLLIKNKLTTATDAFRDEINLRLKLITESKDTGMIKLKKVIALTLEVDALNLVQSIEKLQLDPAESEELKSIKQYLARNSQSVDSTKKMKFTIRRLTAINDKYHKNKQSENASGLEHFYSRLAKISPRLSGRFSNRESSSEESAVAKPITRGRSNSVSSRSSVSSVVANEASDDTQRISDATQEPLRARSKTLLPSKANPSLPFRVKAQTLSRSSGAIAMVPLKNRGAKNTDAITDDDEKEEKTYRQDI